MSQDTKIQGLELTSIWLDEIAGGLLGESREAIEIGKIAIQQLAKYQEAEKLRNSRATLLSVLNEVKRHKEFLIERPEWGTW